MKLGICLLVLAGALFETAILYAFLGNWGLAVVSLLLGTLDLFFGAFGLKALMNDAPNGRRVMMAKAQEAKG